MLRMVLETFVVFVQHLIRDLQHKEEERLCTRWRRPELNDLNLKIGVVLMDMKGEM